MRVFRPIVEATTNLLAISVADFSHRRGIRAKPVGDDAPWAAIFLHDALQKLERCSFVPLRGDHRFQNLALVIDSPPEIAELAVDLHKDLASRAGESHPHALPEPYVTLSSHTAPDVRPLACRKRQ